jgi:flavin-dependent dehydrogenase
MRQLARLGVTQQLDTYHAVSRTRLSFTSGPEFTRASPDLSGRVVPRELLDALLIDRARALGAVVAPSHRVIGLLQDGGRAVGVRYVTGTTPGEVTGRFVVAADGATSVLARQAGLARASDRTAFAVRSYVDGIRGLDDEFRVVVPLVDPESGRTLAGYGWIFPVSADRANIGVGFLRTRPEEHKVNLRTLFRRFIASLDTPGTFVVGPLRGAPLPCDFDPDRCTKDGLLLVGDAARLVDPLSGEGIDVALESGALAGEMIHRALAADRHDVPGYGRELQRRFGRRIAAAWSLVENHEFVWGVISSTVGVDRPLYRGVRRAVRTYNREESTVPPEPDPLGHWLWSQQLLDDVQATQQALCEEVSSELPLLAGAVRELRDEPAEQVRIASLLVCAGALSRGPWRRTDVIRLAVASEFACLALAAHEDVMDQLPLGAREANRFAVSAGDFLLFRAYELAAQTGGWAVQAMSRASADVCVGTLLGQLEGPIPDRAQRLTRAAALTTGTLFSLPWRLGGHLAGSDEDAVERMADIGRALGVAWHSANRGDGATSAGAVRQDVESLYRLLGEEPGDHQLRTFLGVALDRMLTSTERRWSGAATWPPEPATAAALRPGSTITDART